MQLPEAHPVCRSLPRPFVCRADVVFPRLNQYYDVSRRFTVAYSLINTIASCFATAH